MEAIVGIVNWLGTNAAPAIGGLTQAGASWATGVIIGGVGVPLLLSVLKAAAATLIARDPAVKDAAVAGADYVDFMLAPLMRLAEATKQPGILKSAMVLEELDKFLESQGIHGDPKKVTLDRARKDVDRLAAQLFPKKAAG